MVLDIKGRKKLKGQIKLKAAKNSILPILAACIMTKHTVVLKNCVPFLDVLSMIELLKSLGAHVLFIDEDIIINCERVQSIKSKASLSKALRSSIFILGPLLSRFKEANINAPGGCEIGTRPIDLHLTGLKALGVEITEHEHEMLHFDAKKLKGGVVDLAFPSVGATENLMMAAVLLEGSTLINGAAKEPDISWING